MATRDHNPVPQQQHRRKPKPMQTSPDDDEAQAADQSHAGDLGEPQQAKRRRAQELERDEESPGDEAGGTQPRS